MVAATLSGYKRDQNSKERWNSLSEQSVRLRYKEAFRNPRLSSEASNPSLINFSVSLFQ